MPKKPIDISDSSGNAKLSRLQGCANKIPFKKVNIRIERLKRLKTFLKAESPKIQCYQNKIYMAKYQLAFLVISWFLCYTILSTTVIFLQK